MTDMDIINLESGMAGGDWPDAPSDKMRRLLSRHSPECDGCYICKDSEEQTLLPPWKWTIPAETVGNEYSVKELLGLAACAFIIFVDCVALLVYISFFNLRYLLGSTFFWCTMIILLLSFALGVFMWVDTEHDIKLAWKVFKKHNSRSKRGHKKALDMATNMV